VIAGTLFEAVRDALEDEVLNGDGSGNLTGLLHASSGLSTTSFDANGILTTLRKAKTALQTRGVNPTAVVLSASDLESLELLSDGDDRPLFQVEGPVDDAATRVWGMRTFWSANIATGTALLGDSLGIVVPEAFQIADVSA
jgi:HK97 family phage major capsid protein